MQNYFQENNKTAAGLFREIEEACEGLIYISETDVPVLPFSGPAADEPTGELILQQTGANADAAIEEVAFETFFGQLTVIRDWFGEPQKAKAAKFLELQKLLEENLRDRKVFRIGTIQVDIFAVGLTEDGSLMGVTTSAVET